MSTSSISAGARVLAAGCYLGLVPVLWGANRTTSPPFVRHHYRQAAILFGALLILLGLLALALLILSYLLVNHREFYESTRVEVHVFGVIRKLFLAWGVFWGFALGMALLGAARPMPLVYRLAARERAVRWAGRCLTGLYLFLLLAALVALQASRLVPASRNTGAVYMVYEDNNLFPRWLFALAFYPMARAAEATYGPGSAVLIKISRATVAQALKEGQVVFIGSHGTRKGLMLHQDWLLPRDIAAMPKNSDLKYVYLTGCDSGEQRDAWTDAFSPAYVVTYDRLSASLEHAWWLWFRGPEIVRAMHLEESHAE